ncbi:MULTISPECIES: CopD family copper resistance protein [Neisseria]|uniref:Integral membrane protein n=1 Tax=Neisseria dumasiana TaxID=1931275 RepID=A0A1X3DJY1_9NEIS|nr:MULTISPECIES: hypothetical protein [Neisseria]KPN73954.1 membrane protein [Neisseria sp. 74A18]OSI17368.1 hypothetical protein BV914_01115 [Neisseria dumasiana]OSI23545.1 hypothetical protein BV912_03830 [Neisseria dumasiana]OSI35025.1 hypothetical protein BV913_05860 [Neisseria dumasiana]UOO84385.1 hypothetical protein LVJ88_12155 [Neisseria dumasiana]
MNAYSVAHIIHLFCAIAFVGGVFFETLVLSVIHSKRVSREARREVEKAISYRAVRVMPWIVGGVFLSGLAMAHRYAAILADPFGAPFNIQLSLKVLLAFGVLVHFVIAVTKMRRGTLTAAWSKYIHAAVLVHMVLIVLLAKSMFYFSW